MTTVQFAQRSTNFAPELHTPITSERKREKNLLEDAHVSSQLGAKSFHGQAIRFTDFFFFLSLCVRKIFTDEGGDKTTRAKKPSTVFFLRQFFFFFLLLLLLLLLLWLSDVDSI